MKRTTLAVPLLVPLLVLGIGATSAEPSGACEQRIAAGLEGHVFLRHELARPLKPALVADRLAQASATLAERGVQLVVALRPSRASLMPLLMETSLRRRYDPSAARTAHRKLHAELERRGVLSAALMPALEAEEVFLERQAALSPSGAARVAEVLAPMVRERAPELPPALEPRPLKTHVLPVAPELLGCGPEATQTVQAPAPHSPRKLQRAAGQHTPVWLVGGRDAQQPWLRQALEAQLGVHVPVAEGDWDPANFLAGSPELPSAGVLVWTASLGELALALGGKTEPAGDFVVCEAASGPDAVGQRIWGAEDGWLVHRGDVNTDLEMPSQIAESMKELVQVLGERGTQLAVMLVPSRVATHPELIRADAIPFLEYSVQADADGYAAQLGHVRAAGALAPDLMAVGRTGAASGPMFFKRDHHWTPAFSRLAAKAMANLAAPAVADLPKSAFETTRTGMYDWMGRLQVWAERSCGYRMPSEELPRFETRAVTPPGLLDDVPPPEVVLVGTSFSMQRWEDRSWERFNLDGFLEQSLGLETYNAAIPGGGPWNGIEVYLGSKAFAAHPPRLLIWELPSHASDLPDVTGMRRVLATAKGPCDEPRILSGRLQGEALRLEVAGGERISLVFQDRSIVGFELTLIHGEQQETVQMNRTAHAANNGVFWLELSRELSAPISGLVVDAGPKATGRLTVSVCEG